MENLYLIVGLGNPGTDFARTRHNAGFQAVERLARRWQAEWSLDDRFKSRLAKIEHAGRRLLLCQPQTFMNLSGEAVGKLADYFQVPPKRLLVVVDDADLPLGEIRLRSQGSSGGHHGLESVEQHLGTRRYARLRIGIGRTVANAREITGHVLGRFSAAEKDMLDRALERVTGSVECWMSQGIEKAMSQFNGTIDGLEKKDKETE
jgi:PTH1 family peptidyl-tRNA hydrolase